MFELETENQEKIVKTMEKVPDFEIDIHWDFRTWGNITYKAVQVVIDTCKLEVKSFEPLFLFYDSRTKDAKFKNSNLANFAILYPSFRDREKVIAPSQTENVRTLF